ncbi:hypothetical protein BDR05DRAFT_704676 [Suillus weaverae]|nr:hypothetical protein BDR05DRAFT_704676 [Suillus weaverae]
MASINSHIKRFQQVRLFENSYGLSNYAPLPNNLLLLLDFKTYFGGRLLLARSAITIDMPRLMLFKVRNEAMGVGDAIYGTFIMISAFHFGTFTMASILTDQAVPTGQNSIPMYGSALKTDFGKRRPLLSRSAVTIDMPRASNARNEAREDVMGYWQSTMYHLACATPPLT